jgi:hypothetical protein
MAMPWSSKPKDASSTLALRAKPIQIKEVVMRFKRNERVMVRSENVPVRYQNRSAYVDHQFRDGRVLLVVPGRVAKLGVFNHELERVQD